MNIALVPGFVGSSIYERGGEDQFFGNQVWINKVRLAQGALAYLDLAADGESPGPLAGGVLVRSGSPESSCYGPLAAALVDQGHVVQSLGWDWRLDMYQQGRRLGVAMLGLFKSEPFAIVAHSAGGLVARAAVSYIKDHGHYDQVTKIVYLGTPQWGSYYVVAAICRQAALYKSLTDPIAGLAQGGQLAAVLVVDTVLAHLVALWQLLPAWGDGPFWAIDPDNVSRLYDADFYKGVTAKVTQQRLDFARAFWVKMKPLTYREKESFLIGTNQSTPSTYSFNKKSILLIEAVNFDSGDDTVEKQSALPTDALLWAASSQWMHELMPLDGGVQKKVIQFLGP